MNDKIIGETLIALKEITLKKFGLKFYNISILAQFLKMNGLQIR